MKNLDNLHLVLLNPPQIFGQIFDQIFGQVFDQVFGQGFDQVLGEGKNHEYSVQYYWDGKIQCTVLLGRINLLHRLIFKHRALLFYSGQETVWAEETSGRRKPFFSLF